MFNKNKKLVQKHSFDAFIFISLSCMYTHGNKLGNTFSSWGRFEIICFPFFLAMLKFLSHIFHTLA